MKALRVLVPVLVLSLASSASQAQTQAVQDEDDWKMFGSALALIQQFVRLAAQSPDPEVMRKGVDDMLAGKNPDAARAAGQILDEVVRDMPAEYRDTFASVARDIVTIARRDNATRPLTEPVPGASPERALQARKELHAMGLRYWDEQQFLEAVRRNDRLAVELFLAADGLARNPPAKR